MFCSSLRKRAEWSTVPATLLAFQPPRFKETTLDSHDIALPFANHPGQEQLFFRLILLSPSDLRAPTTAMSRIERLYHQGDRNCGVIFLLQEKTPDSNGIHAFMQLQVRQVYDTKTLLRFDSNRNSLFSNLEMPVFPLAGLSSILKTLFSFHKQLMKSPGSAPRPNAASALLPYCSTSLPIPEHARNVLSDICRNVSDLSRAATSQDGQNALKEWLSSVPDAAEDVIAFWGQEFLID